MKLIDSHCHLDMYEPGQRTEIIDSAKNAGIEKLITVGTNLEASKIAVEIADGKNIFATVGIHPEDGKMDIKVKNWRAKLENLANNNKVVAIGETGFDSKSLLDVGFPLQKQIFVAQVKIARNLQLPIIIHCRDMFNETFEVLSEFGEVKGVFHCFCGGQEEAKKVLEMGFLLGIGGIITYPNASLLQNVVKWAPLEKIILETDAPFLAPQEKRGEKNEPKNVKIVAEKISETKNTTFSKICEITSQNAEKLFGLSKKD